MYRGLGVHSHLPIMMNFKVVMASIINKFALAWSEWTFKNWCFCSIVLIHWSCSVFLPWKSLDTEHFVVKLVSSATCNGIQEHFEFKIFFVIFSVISGQKLIHVKRITYNIISKCTLFSFLRTRSCATC